MRIRMLMLATALAALSASGAPALAETIASEPSSASPPVQNRRVNIYNDTNQDVYYFKISNSNTTNWGPDLLGSNVLSPNEVVYNYNVDDGSGQCYFDFRAEFGGGGVRTGMRINVCSVSQIRIRAEGIVGY